MAHLRESNAILGVIAAGLSHACIHEINVGSDLGKPTIVMATPTFAERIAPSVGRLVVIDPAKPETAEHAIVQYLKKIDTEQSTKQAMLALGTIALGLLIFSNQD